MNNSITQTNPFFSRTYTIEDTGLHLQKKSKNSETEIHFSFEQIKADRITLVDHQLGLLIAASITAVLGLIVFALYLFTEENDWSAVPFWLGISAVIFVYYFLTRKKKLYLQLTDGKPVEFLAEKKDLEEVRNFLDELITKRNSYLVSKYGNLNKNLEYSVQLDSLNWLLNMRAISKMIYDEKVAELNKIFDHNPGSKPIGFSFRE